MSNYKLTRDGKLICTGTEFECAHKLQKVQGQSRDWAKKHEGYKIEPVSIKVQYMNIDDWNRPVFKEVDGKRFYGSTELLFPYQESEAVVLEKVKSEDLCFFGRKFNCEPDGNPCNVEIVPS